METKVAELSASDRFWGWYESNKKQALYAGIAVVVIGLGVGFFMWNKNEQQVAAGESLASLSWTMTGPNGTSKPGAADAYLKLAASHPNSNVGARALLMGAGDLFVSGQYDRARTEFERCAREYRDTGLVGQALLGVAACLDAQNKTNEAMTAYKDLVEHHPADPAVPQAKFALGRLAEAQGKPEQARTLFEDVARSDPQGSLGSEAGMRLEELRVKYPALFAPPPAPTPMPAPNQSPTPTITLTPKGTNAPATNGPTIKLQQKP
ncbi:MAG TPA: tetratricopeptide repeat protein [Candidatus Dormibacteraeota bacterium]|nr:tetratricopeptide repeat protein [Candidatus Dormibacteraeota bacterium]